MATIELQLVEGHSEAWFVAVDWKTFSLMALPSWLESWADWLLQLRPWALVHVSATSHVRLRHRVDADRLLLRWLQWVVLNAPCRGL